MENFLNRVVFEGVCEIDEVMLTSKRLGPHGRLPSFQILVFGILERTTRRCLLYVVPNRRRRTLFPIIAQHIDDNSFIILDEFSCYVNNRRVPKTSQITHFLQHKNYIHRWVNHSQTFVDRFDNTIHVNTIERLWCELRPKIRSKKTLDEIYTFKYFSEKETRLELVRAHGGIID